MALKDLIINSEELKEEVLEKVVAYFFRYDPEGNIIIANDDFSKLKGTYKILYYLAAVAGRKFLKVQNSDDFASNSRLAKSLGLKENSIRPWLSMLRKRGLIATSKNKHSLTSQGLYEVSKIRVDRKGEETDER